MAWIVGVILVVLAAAFIVSGVSGNAMSLYSTITGKGRRLSPNIGNPPGTAGGPGIPSTPASVPAGGAVLAGWAG